MSKDDLEMLQDLVWPSRRRSVAGTVAGFVASLGLCLWVVSVHGLGLPAGG